MRFENGKFIKTDNENLQVSLFNAEDGLEEAVL